MWGQKSATTGGVAGMMVARITARWSVASRARGESLETARTFAVRRVETG